MQVDGRQHPGLRAIDFFGGDRLGLDRVNRRQQRVARVVERRLLADFRENQDHSGFPKLQAAAADVGGFLGVDQRLVKPSRRIVGQDPSGNLQRGEILMRAGRSVVADHDVLYVAHATERHGPLAILGRLDRVGGRQHALRPRNRTEQPRDRLERPGLIELARHNQYRVVRLVVHPIEGLQAIDRDVLDVAPRTNHRLAVVVPDICRRDDALAKHVQR